MATLASETLLRRQLRVLPPKPLAPPLALTNTGVLLRNSKRNLNLGTQPVSSMIPTSTNGKSQSSGNSTSTPRLLCVCANLANLGGVVRRIRYTKAGCLKFILHFLTITLSNLPKCSSKQKCGILMCIPMDSSVFPFYIPLKRINMGMKMLGNDGCRFIPHTPSS
jgi:hypothetical protein